MAKSDEFAVDLAKSDRLLGSDYQNVIFSG